jgi:hypothetical protein
MRLQTIHFTDLLGALKDNPKQDIMQAAVSRLHSRVSCLREAVLAKRVTIQVWTFVNMYQSSQPTACLHPATHKCPGATHRANPGLPELASLCTFRSRCAEGVLNFTLMRQVMRGLLFALPLCVSLQLHVGNLHPEALSLQQDIKRLQPYTMSW